MGKIRRVKTNTCLGLIPTAISLPSFPFEFDVTARTSSVTQLSLDTEMPVGSHGQSAPCVLRYCAEVEWVFELVRHLQKHGIRVLPGFGVEP